MLLIELARRYCNRVGGSPGYLEQLEVLCRRLPWQVSEMTPDLIDDYLTQALNHLAPSTVYNHRRMLGRLLTFAASERLVDASILRPLRRVKRLPPSPEAWSHADIRRLLAVAADLRGGVKVANSKLLRAWLLVAYSTGLRLSNLLEIRHDQIRGQRLLVRQAKSKEPHVCYLDDLALEAIAQLPRLGPRIFGDLVCRDKILAKMRDLMRRSEMAGSTKFLRRSGATYAVIAGKSATRHLGHKTADMQKYYVDRLLVAEERLEEPTTVPLAAPLADPSPAWPAPGPACSPRSGGRGTEGTSAAALPAWQPGTPLAR